MFTQNDLRSLIDATAQPAVSVFLPTHVKGREVRQGPVRLRNLLAQAEQKLLGRGMRGEEARALLAPARRMVDDDVFWRHQDRGLAVFVAPGLFRYHRVPIDVAEQVLVSPQFHVKPLLGLLAIDGRFFVLTLSASRARLFEGSRFSFIEREVAFPEGVGAVAAETDYSENTRHASPVARPQSGAPGGIPKTHGFGDSPEEYRKVEQVDYLRRIASALEGEVGTEAAPILVAADPQNRGHFLKIAGKGNIVPVGIDLNPDALDPEDLHRIALEHVSPHFLAARRRALEQFNVLLGNGDARASLTVEEIVRGARFGRVEMLFLAESETLWGHYDEKADEVIARGTPNGADTDLLDYAASHTLLQRGHVDLLPKQDMPRGALAAAIFRY
jgi:Bacterial archaeo-eukaryotic release factor family 3